MKPFLLKSSLAALGVVILASTTASAALVLSEYFNYGPVNVQGGVGVNTVPWGTGGPWQGTSANLNYQGSGTAANNASWGGTGYAITSSNNSTGSMNAQPASTNVRGAQLALSSSLSGEFWVSVMMRPGSSFNAATDSVFLAFNSASYSNSNPNGVGFGIGGNGTINTSLIASNGASITSAASDNLTAGTASNNYYLMLAKVTVNTSATDTIDIWTFANNATVLTTVAGLGTATLSGSGINWGDSIANVWFGASGANGNIDALRISNSTGQTGLDQVLTGVVPEPTTWVLLVGSLTALVVLRPSRHRQCKNTSL